MDVMIEKEIVNEFILKSDRQRVLFELTSLKKRQDCIWSIGKRFDLRYVTDVSKSIDSYEPILEIFKEQGAKNTDDCYLMTLYESKIMPLEKALEENIFKGFFLVYWMKKKIGFWEGEQCSTRQHNAPPRYILKKV